MEGVDYAWARPNLDQLWAAGKRFVVRYLASLPNGKVLLSSELHDLHAKGFAVVLNWEQSSGDMLRGSAVGASHAREALRQANALGAPASIPIYFSCDVDISMSAQMDAVRSYLNGAAGVLGRARVGVYGEWSVIEAMVPSVAAWGWQTYAWSGGSVSGKAHLYQYRNGVTVAGADCDLDRSLKTDFGAWAPGSHVDPPTGTGGDGMYVMTPNGDVWAIGPSKMHHVTAGEWGRFSPKPPVLALDTAAGLEDFRAAVPALDVKAVVTGVLQGLANDPASAVTQDDVDKLVAAIESAPTAIREQFRLNPLT